jgi:hypothetical protein
MATQPLPAIRRALLLEILKQLKIARDLIDESLQGITSADAARRLARQRAEISRVLVVFQNAADQAMRDAAGEVWTGGIEIVGEQLGDVGLAPRISERMLVSIEQFMTHKIADVTRAAIAQINTALTQQLLGVRSMADTISDIQDILGGAPRSRAMTIAYTEIGRVYSAAQYETMLAKFARRPGLRKSWIHSGKAHPRPGHVLCAQETKANPIPVDQPFELVDIRTGAVEYARYPRDPNLSAGESINCGCMMIAVPEA